MGDTIHLMGVYTKMVMRAWFQYRPDAFMRCLAVFLREATGIIVIYFTLLKFDNLNGWDIQEMLFLYSLLFLTYGILIIFFTGLRDFGSTVRNGRFDRFLLRPRGLLFQIIFVNADWFAAIGHGGLGIVLFAVIGGVLIQGAIFLLLATLNIYLLETGSMKEQEILYNTSRNRSTYHAMPVFLLSFV